NRPLDKWSQPSNLLLPHPAKPTNCAGGMKALHRPAVGPAGRVVKSVWDSVAAPLQSLQSSPERRTAEPTNCAGGMQALHRPPAGPAGRVVKSVWDSVAAPSQSLQSSPERRTAEPTSCAGGMQALHRPLVGPAGRVVKSVWDSVAAPLQSLQSSPERGQLPNFPLNQAALPQGVHPSPHVMKISSPVRKVPYESTQQPVGVHTSKLSFAALPEFLQRQIDEAFNDSIKSIANGGSLPHTILLSDIPQALQRLYIPLAEDDETLMSFRNASYGWPSYTNNPEEIGAEVPGLCVNREDWRDVCAVLVEICSASSGMARAPSPGGFASDSEMRDVSSDALVLRSPPSVAAIDTAQMLCREDDDAQILPTTPSVVLPPIPASSSHAEDDHDAHVSSTPPNIALPPIPTGSPSSISTTSPVDSCPECPANTTAKFTVEHLREKRHKLSTTHSYTWRYETGKTRNIKVQLYRMKTHLRFRCICDAELRSTAEVKAHFEQIERNELEHKHTYTGLAEGKLQF
ncbi:hypothetical protein B0H13DRAFT_2394746, partial [Mycena leptocephala]